MTAPDVNADVRARFEAHHGITWAAIQSLPIGSGSRLHLESHYKRHLDTWQAAHADLSGDVRDSTIRASLVELEAENERLREHCRQLTGDKFSDRNHAALRCRAERAEALLRSFNAACSRVIDQDGGILGGIDFSALGAAITAHLSENAHARA